MKQEQIKRISESLKKLSGEKLRAVMRAGSMADFGFGDYVEKQAHRYDENRKLVPVNVSVPRLALHVDCCFRMTLGEKIVLSKGDVFQPSTQTENGADFSWEGFEWDVHGNNRFDEIAPTVLDEEANDFIVEKITVSKWGDLKIVFSNGFVLETFIDSSGLEECWRFFEAGAENHLIVNGQGIEEDDA